MTFKVIERSENFKKSYQKLPSSIKKKFIKQLNFLLQNIRYPSLRAKKQSGAVDVWEARVDSSYRFTFQIINDAIRLLLIGPHDEGLGKK